MHSEGHPEIPVSQEEWQMLSQEIGRFFKRSPPPLAREAEDMIQETLRRAVRAFSNLPLATATARIGYALQIAKHLRVDAFRRFRTQRIRPEGDLQQTAMPDDSDDAAARLAPRSNCESTVEEFRDAFRQWLLRDLDVTATDLLVLTRFDGYTVTEAAVSLRLTLRQAEAVRRRGLRFLSASGRRKRLLEQLGLEPRTRPNDSEPLRPLENL